jgi:hypothetical protein
MKTYENDDDVYIKAYCHDTCRIVAALSKKARIRGRGVDEVKLRLIAIEKRISKVVKQKMSIKKGPVKLEDDYSDD